MSEFFINENIQFFNKGVLIYVKTYEEAQIAKNAGILSVIVLFDTEYNMARFDLVLNIKNKLNLHCIAQSRENNMLEIFLLNGCKVDGIYSCIKDPGHVSEIIKHDKYESHFLTSVDSLQAAISSINEHYSVLKSGNKECSIIELKNIFKNINKKITEFYTFKNINSMNKFSKEVGINRKIVENIAQLPRLPVPHIAEGLIVNPVDAVNVMRIGYDAILLSNDMFNTSNPQLMIKLIANAVYNFSNDKEILDSCIELYTSNDKTE